MAAPNWPATLPPPLQSGYGYAPQKAAVESNMDNGTVAVRRRFTKVPKIVNVSYQMESEQLETFEAFFNDDLNSGAIWFNTPLQNGAAIANVLAQVVQSQDNPYTVAQVQDQPNYWTVTLQLRTLTL